MKNVLEWLEASESAYPDKAVYIEDSKEITFRDVLNASRRIGTALAGVEGAAPIAVISGRKVETITAYLGIVYSGHAYAPIDGKLPRHRIDIIIETLRPSAILADAENLALAEELAQGVPVFQLEKAMEEAIDEEKLADIRRQMIITDPLYVIFTSGSTGRPKGVITSHQSLICYIESYAAVMEIDETDRLGNQSPLDYIAAIRDIYVPLYKGCSSVIIPKVYFMEPNRLFRYMNEHKVTSVGWSTSAFTVVLSLGAFEEVKLDTLRKICFSGSVMPASCLAVWQKNLPEAKFVNQYGPTEATASCTYYEVDHLVRPGEQLPIGRPYDNYRVFLLNEDLTETPKGEIGEICVSGPILALGYFNDRERTEKSFLTNPNSKGYPERMYRTGDYGRIREDGLLEFHGRMDRQVKHMGHRVELDEIEYAAGQIDGVEECISLYDKEKEMLYLFYVGGIPMRQVVLGLRQVLPGFMVPRKVRKVSALPRLASGKIDMITLKEEM